MLNRCCLFGFVLVGLLVLGAVSFGLVCMFCLIVVGMRRVEECTCLYDNIGMLGFLYVLWH